MFDWLGDALTYAGDKLVIPTLTGVAVGLALRAAAIPGEVTDHTARAEESDADLSRWVRDRDRQLTAEISQAVGLAKGGIIEDSWGAPVPKELEHLPPGDQSTSGAFIGRAERIMRQALHEYRDEASGKVRVYRAMARSEGWFHRVIRRWRWLVALGRNSAEPAPLALTEVGRELLATWRQRTLPVYGQPTATVQDDPTQAPDAADVRLLEATGGLAWKAAAKSRIQADN